MAASAPSELDRIVQDSLERGLAKLGAVMWRHRRRLTIFAGVLLLVFLAPTWLSSVALGIVGALLLVAHLPARSNATAAPAVAGRITQPFAIGTAIDANEEVHADIFHRHVLIGGQTGFGKTNLLDMIIGVGVRDAKCKVLLIDVAKRGAGLGKWEHEVERLVIDRTEALELLATLQGQLNETWTELRKAGRWETDRDDPTTLLVVDELAPLAMGKEGKSASVALWELLSVGRAAGLNVVVAMQKPHSGVIDTNVRDLFSHRFAFRASTPEMGTTITGFPYAMPPSEYPVGTALMISDEGEPRRVKTYHSLEAR